ncbi:hypothetical protein B7P43_G00390 [Cryptotermes secundus]|uniref:Endonuclease/exonuclease/phosphatase domain-containing protein n=1 Tax=Cryptotermes secundus TaxID=105785 RepID=A0A2J7R8U2_9NEOP|nr:hypothetical protein B7P43_G00390 [Cryptotermes secundus]
MEVDMAYLKALWRQLLGEPEECYVNFNGEGGESHELGVILRGRRCDIIVLNVHAPTEDKIDEVKSKFYEELEHVLGKITKYHKKILLGNFNANVGTEDISKDRRRYSSILDVRSFRAADCDTDHYLVEAKVRERLAVSKQAMHRAHKARFSLQKVNQLEGKEQYCVEISNRFAALENLEAKVDINKRGKLLERISEFHPESR